MNELADKGSAVAFPADDELQLDIDDEASMILKCSWRFLFSKMWPCTATGWEHPAHPAAGELSQHIAGKQSRSDCSWSEVDRSA